MAWSPRLNHDEAKTNRLPFPEFDVDNAASAVTTNRLIRVTVIQRLLKPTPLLYLLPAVSTLPSPFCHFPHPFLRRLDMAHNEKSQQPQEPAEKLKLAQLQVQEHDQESLSFGTQTPLDRDQSSLPTPATTPSKPQRAKIPAAAIIPVWIILSSTVILYNNHVYNTYGFRYPVFLVTWHLTFAVSPSLLSLFPTSLMFSFG